MFKADLPESRLFLFEPIGGEWVKRNINQVEKY